MNNDLLITLVFNEKGETFEEKITQILEKNINNHFSIDLKSDTYNNNTDR